MSIDATLKLLKDEEEARQKEAKETAEMIGDLRVLMELLQQKAERPNGPVLDLDVLATKVAEKLQPVGRQPEASTERPHPQAAPPPAVQPAPASAPPPAAAVTTAVAVQKKGFWDALRGR